MGLTENLIEHDLGCGIFQTVAVTMIYWLPMVPIFCCVQMMSFGGYNPGWSCAGNVSENEHGSDLEQYPAMGYGDNISISMFNASSAFSNSNSTLFSTWTNQTFGFHELPCALYTHCPRVEFSKTASTIVTEWELLCDKAYIPPLIISILMAGVLVGSLFSGNLIDMAGRKRTFYGCFFIMGVISCVSIFSVSWEMFAALQFLQGVFCACSLAVNLIYPSEFLTRKWRAPISGSPAWSISGIVFGTITMLLKNWKHVFALTSVLIFLCCLPYFWIPESLRWLEVKNKSRKFRNAVEKIAIVNKKQMPRFDSKDLVTEHNVNGVDTELNTGQKPKSKSPVKSLMKMKKYSFADLFRPGYKVYTIVVSSVWFMLCIIISSISFGVKALGGNFYINLILLNAMSIPFSLFPVVAPNLIGRKKAIFACLSLITICLLTMIFLELFVSVRNGKNTWTLIAVMGVVAGSQSGRAILVLLITEIYPTIVRGLALSWGSFVSRIGAIISPFLIPKDGGGNVFIWYSTLSVLALISCCLVAGLPETKGSALKETFDVAENNNSEENNDLDDNTSFIGTPEVLHCLQQDSKGEEADIKEEQLVACV